MRNAAKLHLFMMMTLIVSACTLAAPPPLDALLRPSQYDEMTISPSGEYLATSFLLEDRSVLVIVERSTMRITGRVDPGKEGYIEAASWVTAERLFVTTSKRFGQNVQPWLLPTVYAVDADGRNRSRQSMQIIDLLANDEEHVLIRRCRRQVTAGCLTEVRRVSVSLRGAGDRVVEGPRPNSHFLADNAGRVRFAWGWDKDDTQWLSVLEDDGADNGKEASWYLLNDEKQTGIEVVPIGTSTNNQVAYFLSERAMGTDAIESFDFATGERRIVLRHDDVDPRAILWSADGSEPIGVVFNTPIPTFGFWDEAHADAVFMREIEKAFPGEFAMVTSFTRNGTHAVATVSSDRDPGRFYLIERSSGQATLLNKRRPWLDPSRLGRTEPVRLNSRDGTSLAGFITYPPGGAKRNVPMIVVPHGGPYEVYDDWLFDEDIQILATQGYAVLRVNFRGSGGYGRRFVEAGLREWGGRMQDDVLDATRWAVSQGIADPARMCIYGASYGGYAALMGVIREPDTYRCAIAVAAPTDLDISWRWGDVQDSRYGRNFLEKALGSDPADLARRSPARRAGEIKAEIMLAHGGRDYRVSPEHSRAMRSALDAAGKEYVGYFPPDEEHGIYGQKNREKYYSQLLRFLRSSMSKTAEAEM